MQEKSVAKTLQWALTPFKKRHNLDMLGVREHIDRLNGNNLVSLIKNGYVAGLCGGIAADVDYALRSGLEYHINHIRMHSGAGRIGYYDIGPAVPCYKLLIEHILHVTGKELGIDDIVERRIDLGVLNCLGNIFYTHHLFGLGRYELRDCSGSGVEVIDHLFRFESGQFAYHRVETVGLTAVGLGTCCLSHTAVK